MQELLNWINRAETELQDLRELTEELPQKWEIEDIPEDAKTSLVIKADQLRTYVTSIAELLDA